MKTAFLFPGQGSQYVGMGRDLADSYPSVRVRIELASDLAGFDVGGAMFGVGADDQGAAERLRQTNVTQPALYVHSMAAWLILEEAGVEPDFVAGHSLGEYSALAAASAISFEDGLRLVAERGRLMAAADRKATGTMAAVIGLAGDDVVQLCGEVEGASAKVVRAANFNAPEQVVVSGDVDAVEELCRRAPDAGARKVVPLVVGGAFHSPLMADARDGLAAILSDVEIRTPRCPIVLNVTAEPETDPETIRAVLLDQLTSPVRWSQSLERLAALGAERFVEVGAGKVLSGLVKRTIGRTTETIQVGTADELKDFLQAYRTQAMS